MGQSNGSIVEIKDALSKTEAKSEAVIMSHSDGECWGLCVINEEGVDMFITAGDDNTLYLYDISERKVVGKGKIQAVTDLAKIKKKKVRGGASSQSQMHPHLQARALCYNPQLN